MNLFLGNFDTLVHTEFEIWFQILGPTFKLGSRYLDRVSNSVPTFFKICKKIFDRVLNSIQAHPSLNSQPTRPLSPLSSPTLPLFFCLIHYNFFIFFIFSIILTHFYSKIKNDCSKYHIFQRRIGKPPHLYIWSNFKR
jgi:hypothetical protein